MSARDLIFHINISYDKTFPWEPLFFYLVTLTLEFDPTLTLLITFEQWVVELLYSLWLDLSLVSLIFNKYLSFHIAHERFLWQDLPTGINLFYPCDLDHLWNWPLSGHLCFTNTSCFLIQLWFVMSLSHITKLPICCFWRFWSWCPFLIPSSFRWFWA